MSKGVDWRNFFDEKGMFEFPNYIYRTIMELMKQSLDLGTLLSDDPAKLRAYKEQIKKEFKNKWFNIAEALEQVGVLVECVCARDEFCKLCGGSRFKLNEELTSHKIQEIGYAFGSNINEEAIAELNQAMDKLVKDQIGEKDEDE